MYWLVEAYTSCVNLVSTLDNQYVYALTSLWSHKILLPKGKKLLRY